MVCEPYRRAAIWSVLAIYYNIVLITVDMHVNGMYVLIYCCPINKFGWRHWWYRFFYLRASVASYKKGVASHRPSGRMPGKGTCHMSRISESNDFQPVTSFNQSLTGSRENKYFVLDMNVKNKY